MAKFTNYSKLDEHSEESSVDSLQFGPGPSDERKLSQPGGDFEEASRKNAVKDLLGSLSDDPGKNRKSMFLLHVNIIIYCRLHPVSPSTHGWI